MESKKESVSSGLGRRSMGTGLGAALIASLCCVIPLIALILGIGGASALLVLGKFRPYFIGASLVFLVIALSLVLHRNERNECCSLEEKRRNQFLLPLYVLGTYLVIFSLVTYFVTPRLYSQLNSKKVNSSTTKINSSAVKLVNKRELNLFIQGFYCPSCAAGVKSALSRREGIVEADIEANGRAKIVYDASRTSPQEILRTIKNLGYNPQILEGE